MFQIFFFKVILLIFKEFYGLQDNLKNIWKTFNLWSLSWTAFRPN